MEDGVVRVQAHGVVDQRPERYELLDMSVSIYIYIYRERERHREINSYNCI